MRKISLALFQPYFIRQVIMLLLLYCLLPGAQAQTWNSVYGFGGTPGESGRAVCTDASGNTYYIGNFGGTIDFDPGGGSSPLTATNSDIVVTKYNAAGTFQWAVQGGGAGFDNGFGIATDGTNVYIIGTYAGTSTFGPFTVNQIGGTDVVVAKLSAATGVYAWATGVGSLTGDAANAICIDASGNPIALGTYNTSITLGATTLNATGGSSSDLFVAKFNTATGAVLWGNGGGASANGDNGSGGGICYVPGLDEVVVTGSYNVATATYGALPNVANSGLNDIIVLEMNASTGAFLSAVNVSNSADEAGLGIAYDAYTQDVVFTGFFDGASINFGAITLTSDGDDEIFVARYAPATNTFIWAVKPTGGAVMDRGNAICSSGSGLIAITGQFENTLTFGSTSLTSTSGAFADIFVAGLSITDGSWLWALQAGSTSTSVDDIGRGISCGGPLLKMAVTGQYGGNATFGSITPPAAVGSTDLFFAQMTPALAGVITSTTNATCANGCNGSASVLATGGVPPYTYSWSPSGGSAATATGLCVGTYTVTITDNAATSIMRSATIGLPTTQLASANTSNAAFPLNASNTNIYDASCNLIAKLVPNGASPIGGNVAAQVWFESGVPVYPLVTGKPYVARHYQLMPASGAATATGQVTLYFTQAEFNAFNAAPGSTANLPTGPSDAAGKANVRLSKFAGTSNNGTGLPGSYTGTAELIDPVDGDIVWNATLSRWEISFNVVGFSGFFLQTYTAILPVTWLSVNGALNAHGQPVITWKVQEQEVASYSIEKSVDDQPFTTIVSIAAKGNGENEYSFQEVLSLAGKASYRIKQTDLNGRATYSRILLLKSDRKGWITLYPNPVKRTATLNVTDKELLNTTAYLYDRTGRELQRIQITQSVTTIRMDQYNAGVYTLKLKNGQTIRILKE